MSAPTRTRRAPGVSLLAAARAAAPDASLDGALTQLRRYEEAAERFARRGRLDDAIDTVQLGALSASLRHPGVYSSERMERVLAEAGATLRPLPPRPVAPTGRVLHVATETYATGGHTRMIWRWIDRDRDHTARLVITSQGLELPHALVASVEAAGGEVIALQPELSRLARAQQLRDQAADVDLIVMHVHPMDSIPTLAFAEAEHRPPIIYFNHADHLFWLGASIADVVQCLRPAAIELAEARGIPAPRRIRTSAPVAGSDGNGLRVTDRAADRAEVLEELRWPEDSIVLFTAGSVDKYRGAKGLTLLDLVEPLLRGDPRLRLLVAGPPENRAWKTARTRFDGRVRTLGPVPSLGRYFAAADIYLESQPFGGTGSNSEAAAHGLPVLSHAATELEALLFCADPDYGSTIALGAAEYRRALGKLIADPDARAEAGARGRAAVSETDAAWERHVEHVYARAAELGPIRLADLAPAPAQPREPRELLIDQWLRNTHLDVEDEILAALSVTVLRVAKSPALRRCFDSVITLAAVGATKPYDAAVFLGVGDPDAFATVLAEFRWLQDTELVKRFAIGLRPEEAEAAIPVLEAALDDDSLIVELFVDARAERLLGDGVLEVVLPGGAVAGRPAPHECEPLPPAPPVTETKPHPSRRERRRSARRRRR